MSLKCDNFPTKEYLLLKWKYNFTVDILPYWFGFSSFAYIEIIVAKSFKKLPEVQ